MTLLRPIFWGQGMFLQPQHFQQQDRYHEAQLHRAFQLFSPFCWGVHSLTLNEAALQNFSFTIDQCEVVTWDGAILRFRGDSSASNIRIEPRSFEGALDPGGRPLSVHLGIKRLQLEENNVQPIPIASIHSTGDSPGGHQRFALMETPTPDLHGEDNRTSDIQYLLYQAHILFDLEANRSQDYELVKIAEVHRAADGKGGVLSKRYFPPSVTVRSSLGFENLLKEIRDLLTAKGRELAEYSGHRKGERSELGARDAGAFVMLQTVNRYIPILHHYLEIGDVHPVVFYGILRQLVGDLSIFSSLWGVLGERKEQQSARSIARAVVQDSEEAIPPYRHDQLWPCFSIAAQRVKEILEELTAQPTGDVLLQYDTENDFFTASLPPQFFEGNNRYFLAINTDVKPSEMYALLQKVGKITSREEMPQLMKSALSGLKIEPLETPPEELRRRAHYRYFIIDQRSPQWQQIRQQQNIAVRSTTQEISTETEIRLLVIYDQ